MSLKAFHIVFVAVSTLLSLLFGSWCLARDATLAGIASFVVALTLIIYGVWFWQKITTAEEDRQRRRKLFRPVPIGLLALWISGEHTATACSVCYGEAQGPMIDAARLGVWLLFGLVLIVQLSFAAFFVTLWRRAKRFRHSAAGMRGPIGVPQR